MTNTLSFESFRTGDVAEVQTLDVNPFMRLKTKTTTSSTNTIFGSSTTRPFVSKVHDHKALRDYEEVPD
jgi:hypothetical protein